MGDDEDDFSVEEMEFWEQLENRKPGIDHANARGALREARQGDWRALEKRVRSEVELNIKERAFVADIIAGKIKRPKHDYLDFEAHRRWWEIACYVVWGETQNIRKKPVIADAVRVFGVSRSGVYEALKNYREEAENYRESLTSYGVVSQRGRQVKISSVISNFYWKPGERVPKHNYPGLKKTEKNRSDKKPASRLVQVSPT